MRVFAFSLFVFSLHLLHFSYLSCFLFLLMHGIEKVVFVSYKLYMETNVQMYHGIDKSCICI